MVLEGITAAEDTAYNCGHVHGEDDSRNRVCPLCGVEKHYELVDVVVSYFG